MTNRRSFLKSIATTIVAAALVCRLKITEESEWKANQFPDPDPTATLTQEYLDAVYEALIIYNPVTFDCIVSGVDGNTPVPRYNYVNGQFVRV